MRHLGQIHHEHLVRDGLAERHRQFESALLEFLTVQDALHRDYLRLGIRHLDTYCALAGNRGYNTYAESREREGYIVLQVADLGDTHARRRRDFI